MTKKNVLFFSHFYFLGVVIFLGLEKDLSFTFLVLLVAISI